VPIDFEKHQATMGILIGKKIG